jgi:Tfp pilus assembly protein PilZ
LRLLNHPDNCPVAGQISWILTGMASAGMGAGKKLEKIIRIYNKTLDFIAVHVYISTFCCTMNL